MLLGIFCKKSFNTKRRKESFAKYLVEKYKIIIKDMIESSHLTRLVFKDRID